MVMLFASMMEGTRYTRRGNTETTIYFIAHIGQDYGKDRMVNSFSHISSVERLRHTSSAISVSRLVSP